MKLNNVNPFSYQLDGSDIRMIQHNLKVNGTSDTIASYLHELDLPNYLTFKLFILDIDG